MLLIFQTSIGFLLRWFYSSVIETTKARTTTLKTEKNMTTNVYQISDFVSSVSNPFGNVHSVVQGYYYKSEIKPSVAQHWTDKENIVGANPLKKAFTVKILPTMGKWAKDIILG